MMAAPVRSRTVQNIFKISAEAFQKRYVSSRTGYYILIPEVPPDTPKTNPIMRHKELPMFTHIQPENTITGCAKMSLDFIAKLDTHIERLSESKESLTFDEIFHPIEEISAPLNFGYKTAQILFKTCYSKHTEVALRRVLQQVKKTKAERFISLQLHNVIQELNEHRDRLTPVQQRLVDMYLLECKHSGIQIKSNVKEILAQAMKEQTEKEITFLQRATTQKGMYYLEIGLNEYNLVRGMPVTARVQVAMDRTQPDKGPWRITLLDHVYYSFIETCPNREKRMEIWRRFNSNATQHTADTRNNNIPIIEEIRDARRRIAHSLGYLNYAKLSMETKMMKDVKNVLSMLNEYKSAFLPAAVQELDSLTDYAKDRGLTDDIQMWDIPFYRQEYCKETYRVMEHDIVPYFPLQRVLESMFKLSSKLFNIKIKPRQVMSTQIWDSTVSVYDVLDGDGTNMATLYLDPFTRSSKFRGTFTDHGRDRSVVAGCTPISYLMMSLTKPTMRKVPAFMTYKQVVDLFYEFGHALQHMLTTVPYCELAGQNNVEWDAQNVCAHVMKLWALQPHVVNDMNMHFESGEKLGSDIVDRLLKDQRHMFAYDKCIDLFKSAFDMECHMSEEPMRDIQQNMWRMFMPIPLDKYDWAPCSDTTMWFKRDNAAAYYSNLCSEMLAVDCFDSFRQVGLEDNEVVNVGKRFRETFLSMGGGTPALEVFRQFQGRNPSWTSLLEHYGVIHK